MPDIFDPRTWDATPHLFRMHAGETADVECLVDEEDYLFFTRWLWHPQRNRNKIYFRRAITDRSSGERQSSTRYLHVEIMNLIAPPPSDRHIVDHWDGNSLNCQRYNLRWATRRENNRNRFGVAYRQRVLHV